MAGTHPQVALQGHQALEGLEDLPVAAAGEVRSAAGAGKERVADEEGIADLERDAAGGVAGGVEDGDRQRAEGERIALVVIVQAVDDALERIVVDAGAVRVKAVDIDRGRMAYVIRFDSLPTPRRINFRAGSLKEG